MKLIKKFISEEYAATTVEYALILVMIAAVLLFSLVALGNESGTFWGRSATMLNTINQ